MPAPSLPPVISHTHIFVLTPTHVNTPTQNLQTAPGKETFLLSGNPQFVLVHSLAVDGTLSHDKVHDIQSCSALLAVRAGEEKKRTTTKATTEGVKDEKRELM